MSQQETPANTSVANIITMHSDTSSSDTFNQPGPGIGEHLITHHNFLTTFSTILNRSDGHIMALSSSYANLVINGLETLNGLNNAEDATEQGNDANESSPIIPQIWLIDGETGLPLNQPHNIVSTGLLSGVYAYLDQSDNGLYMTSEVTDEASGAASIGIIKVTIDSTPDAQWNVETIASIGSAISDDDYIVSLSPDADGDIWFSSAQGVVGICAKTPDNDYLSPQFINLPLPETSNSANTVEPERVNNSFSTASMRNENGNTTLITAIVTNKALYLLTKDPSGHPAPFYGNEQSSRLSYDRGTSLKPGQLAYPPLADVANLENRHPLAGHLIANHAFNWGTGATPTFFGTQTGADYVMITDNSDLRFALCVWDVHTGDLICTQTLFSDDKFTSENDHKNGTENSAIGVGDSIIVSSTYGYPYPVPPFFKTTDYPFTGGLTRIDLGGGVDDRKEASEVWATKIRSSAVPKYSIADNYLYIITRNSTTNNDAASPDDYYAYTVVDFDSGQIVGEPKDLRLAEQINYTPNNSLENISPTTAEELKTALFALDDPLQMAPCFTTNSKGEGVMWQGTMDGFYRIQKLEKSQLQTQSTNIETGKQHTFNFASTNEKPFKIAQYLVGISSFDMEFSGDRTQEIANFGINLLTSPSMPLANATSSVTVTAQLVLSDDDDHHIKSSSEVGIAMLALNDQSLNSTSLFGPTPLTSSGQTININTLGLDVSNPISLLSGWNSKPSDHDDQNLTEMSFSSGSASVGSKQDGHTTISVNNPKVALNETDGSSYYSTVSVSSLSQNMADPTNDTNAQYTVVNLDSTAQDSQIHDWEIEIQDVVIIVTQITNNGNGNSNEIKKWVLNTPKAELSNKGPETPTTSVSFDWSKYESYWVRNDDHKLHSQQVKFAAIVIFKQDS